MATDFALDENDALRIVDNDFVFISDAEEVAQAVKIALRFLLGEWKFDPARGLDWLGTMFSTQTSLEQKEAAVRSTILGVEGVSGLLAFQFAVDPINRGALITYTATTIYGIISGEIIAP
jgi:hypothetical protein